MFFVRSAVHRVTSRDSRWTRTVGFIRSRILTNPSGNLRLGETKPLYVDLSSDELPAPRLKRDVTGVVWVEAYTDFKLHDIVGPEDSAGGSIDKEPLDMNQSVWSKKF